jgi:hypothetical protein
MKNSSRGRGGRGRGRFDQKPQRLGGQGKFVDDVVYGRCTIASEYEAQRFFKGAGEYGDDLGLLYILTDPAKKGKEAIQSAFRIGCNHTNVKLLNESVIPFLALLGKEELSKGSSKSCTEECYQTIYKIPGVLNELRCALRDGNIADTSAVAWFIASVARADPEARNNPLISEIADILAGHDSRAVRDLVTILFPCKQKQEMPSASKGMGAAEVGSLEELQALEPQHDNDDPFDYRNIQIMPTADEINSSFSSVSLSSAQASCRSLEGGSGDASGKTAMILDRQFRLLRADMILPLVEELGAEFKLPALKQRRIFSSPKLSTVSMEGNNSSIVMSVQMPTALRGRVSKMKTKECSVFFEEAGRRILSKDSMLVFVDNSKGNVRAHCVGLVTRRDPKQFSERAATGVLLVGVTFQHDDIVSMLSLLGAPDRKSVSQWVFQASSSYFSYSPVLSRLQEMSGFPFEDEIVHGKLPLEVSGKELLDITDEDKYVLLAIPSEIRAKLSRDPSQLFAAEYAMTHRLTVIQGW